MTHLAHYTGVQCHFVRGVLNHRLRFGRPDSTIKLDKYRRLACFKTGKTLGYIRWRANEYGTQDWRFFILKAQSEGILTRVPGVTSAVKVLASFNGTQTVRRALKAFDQVEALAKDELETLPDSYWLTFQNDQFSRKSINGLSRRASLTEPINVD